MNKKWLLTALVVCTCLQGTSLMAMEEVQETALVSGISVEAMQEISESKSMYHTISGKVTSVSQENDTYEVMVGSEMDGTRLLVQSGTLIIDVETLGMLHPEGIKEGMQVTVVLHNNTPMTLSLPPTVSTQAAILVNSDSKNVEVAYFDETLTNEANTLKLNISEDTIIQNSRGERRIFTAEDIQNKDAIVIYTVSTRSIPAQTTPEYVMILEPEEETSIIEETETRNLPDTNWLPVREVAEALGYKVTWEHETKSVSLTKEGKSITLKTEEKEINQSMKLENNTFYVTQAIIEELK